MLMAAVGGTLTRVFHPYSILLSMTNPNTMFWVVVVLVFVGLVIVIWYVARQL
jgi:hypothetical protein